MNDHFVETVRILDSKKVSGFMCRAHISMNYSSIIFVRYINSEKSIDNQS